MSERTILVCDVCGDPAVQTVSIKVGGRSLHKDLCQKHLAELTAGARPARRGRRRGTTAAASEAATPAKRPSRRRTTRTKQATAAAAE